MSVSVLRQLKIVNNYVVSIRSVSYLARCRQSLLFTCLNKTTSHPLLPDLPAKFSSTHFRLASSQNNPTKVAMEAHGVVPDVIDVAPAATITIKYDSGSTVEGGNELTPTQVQNEPIHIEWPVEDGAHYTLCMTDPDAPSRATPTFREWHHWLVVNIPNDINEMILKKERRNWYSELSHLFCLHRYVFLAYKQPGPLTCDEPRLTNRSGKHRGKFSIRKFADKYHLGQPIAGNVYQAKWDDYVPKLYEQLGDD
uniref:Uncharacterized protein n=1 Tax=Daphnia galeata TaxID=27404 RepID=A0A8J2RXU0_9CRUS|nr:unnamed protein product [Daphnia galeata]